jgi:bis(5'-nucleosyl)-tetraphosphatase (symmetrical)
LATYAIGDIQGCYDELMRLLDEINFNADKDKLWFTGDLVNRGPKSLKTLRFIRSLEENAVAVLGNHDLHLLATAFHHKTPGKKDTLDKILQAPDRNQLMDWLRTLPLMHADEDTGLVMVHAGLHPDWSIDKAKLLAREVEDVLQSDKHIKFYKHMYGNKPSMWSDDLDGWSRLRYITNIFTRIRFCTPTGKISLACKREPGKQPQGYQPWFSIEHRASRHTPIIFGHWSTLVLCKNIEYPNVYPLDTGCLWGGHLTAMQIDLAPYDKFSIECQNPTKKKRVPVTS